MLTEMKAKGQEELEAEQKVFSDYVKFVQDRKKELEQEISVANSDIEELTATASKADSDVASLGERIKALDAEMDELEGQKKAAEDMRKQEKDQFLQEQTDYSESLYALDRAIETLGAQSASTPQAEMLLQKMSKTVKGMGRVLAELSLLQEESRDDGAPAVAAYEFQSSGIVDMLKSMRDRFQKELGELEKEEMNKSHAFDMQVQHLANTIDNLKSEREEAAANKAKNKQLSAESKGTLAKTKVNLADASKFLADLKSTYEIKASQYTSNQKVRSEEITALQKAIEIMSGDNAGGAYKRNVNFVQKPLSLLQVGMSARKAAGKQRATAILQNKARALRSTTLLALVSQLKANPFAKVVDMIETLLEKMKEEAAQEAEHKGWCDEELKKNKQRRSEKESDTARLHAEIEEKIVSIQKMAKEIETLSAEQAELAEAMSEATKVRNEEKAENKKAVEESKEGRVAVKQAIAVLKEFYSKQGDAELLQNAKAGQVPEMAAYGGMQNSKGGVVGMMEVIESDFARVEADTTAAENQAASQYDQFMEDAKADTKAKHDSEFQLGLDKDQAEYEQEQAQKDLDSTQKQLDSANAYFAELKPQCVEVQVSFAERVKMRNEEIAALKEAYKALNGETLA